MTFLELGLIEPISRALAAEGYTTPTPIQSQAIPLALQGRDLLASAQTGTGKTAAFAIPTLQLLFAGVQAAKDAAAATPPSAKVTGFQKNRRPIRALVLAPTRELAEQIKESIGAYGKNMGMYHTAVYGGVNQRPQTDALQRGVDILIATPGRLMDLMDQGYVNLSHVEIFVLDEADRMLDMGFIHDITKISEKLPAKRQTLFFSATLPPNIQKLANSLLRDPATVSVVPTSTVAERVNHTVYFVPRGDKKNLLIHILKETGAFTALVFTRTKHGADRVMRELHNAEITAQAIHGDKTQRARQQALDSFKRGKTQVLVATDIAARGIDVEDLALVVNYDLPNEPETYVHRIGRTGRAGAEGKALSFCDVDERSYLRAINKLLGKAIPIVADHPYAAKAQAGGQTATEEDARLSVNFPATQQRRNGQGGNHMRSAGFAKNRRSGPTFRRTGKPADR